MSLIERKLERAEEEADAIWKSVYQPDESETVTPPEKAEAETEETPEEAALEMETEETAVAAAPETPPVKPPESDTTDWKQKFQTLDGKYKAEVPRLSAEVGQWREYATSLSRRISELEETAKSALKKTDAPETDPDLEALAERDPDFASIIKKLRDDHKREIAELRRDFETGVTADLKSVKEDLHLSKQERFDLALRAAGIPDWKTVDHDPAFLEWLSDPVPYTRATKLDFLKDAARNLDADAASKFFLDFKASQNTEDTPLTAEESSDKLNKFVAPPRSGGPSIPKKSGQPGLTKAQYERLMDPRAKFNPADYGGRTEKQV